LIDIETYDGQRKIMRNSAAPVRDAEGVIVGAVIVNEDVTDRVRAEEALRRSEDELRLVIDTIPVMAWTLRPDGVVDFLNRRWIEYSGLSLEQYVADPTGVIHPEDVTRVLERWRVQLGIGEAYDDEMRLRRADGEYRWFLVRTAPLRNEHGDIVKWYGVSTDIEDRKRAEEASRQANDRLRILSRRRVQVQEEERQRLARELHDQVGQLLTAAKIDVQSASTLSGDSALNNKLIGADSNLPRGDAESETACYRVAVEAVTNSIRHAHAQKIVMELHGIGHSIQLRVCDDGRGFNVAKIQRAAERERLGLSGMRERAFAVGGQFEIKSAPGEGTEVIARFPFSSAPEPC
jgi:PAS domain S-box-containing protein